MVRIYNAKYQWSQSIIRELNIAAANIAKAVEKGNQLAKKHYGERLLSVVEIMHSVEVAK
jgi:hypothetical protein